MSADDESDQDESDQDDDNHDDGAGQKEPDVKPIKKEVKWEPESVKIEAKETEDLGDANEDDGEEVEDDQRDAENKEGEEESTNTEKGNYWEPKAKHPGGRYYLRQPEKSYRFRYGMEGGNNPKGKYSPDDQGVTLLVNRQELEKVYSEGMREYVIHDDHMPKENTGTCIKPADGFGHKYSYASHVLLAQMSANQGLKKFGERAENAIKAEFKQLIHGKDVFIPKFFSELSQEQRKRALKAITLIDHKRSGKVKGRTVANGSVQRGYIPADEASSPTVTTEAVFLTAVMNAKENRVVASCDISGAFLQALMDDFVVVVFEDKMVELMVEIEPGYAKYIHTTKKGKKILYVKLKKAMYGCLKAARLWWEELSKYLKNHMGFEPNPYDACVANKQIEGSQCTIIWHVDDLKISHKKREVVEKVIKQIEERFEKMSVNIGSKHTYVGMDFEYLRNGQVVVSMIGYINDAIAEFPEEVSDKVLTPAAVHLFEVETESEPLDAERRSIFHRIVAMLLFVSKRARPDIQVAVAFLTTRVLKSDVHDWKKLARLLGYLKSTINLKLHLSCDEGTPIIKWWVDASYAVHHDMRSHTGAMLSLGGGSVYSKSSRQKINTKSSTEAELIAASDMSGQILWTLYFLKSQGYEVDKNVVYQDNQSAILLERNGKLSSSQRTRHIKIRYFFIKDRIEDGEMQVVYCPTDDMIGDFFTKPLQGEKFKKFRKLILGLSDESIQEGVGTDGSQSQLSEGTHLSKSSEF